MGMFDYTYHKCPLCGAITEGQSKAGDCGLDRYFFGDIAYELPLFRDRDENAKEAIPAPLEVIAEAVKYGLECSNCGCKTKPVVTHSYTLVPF